MKKKLLTFHNLNYKYILILIWFKILMLQQVVSTTILFILHFLVHPWMETK